MSELHDAAVALLPRTILLRDRSKAPVREQWTTIVETPETLRDYLDDHPDANIGVRCGGGLIVVDIDPRRDGHKALEVIEANITKLPITPRVLTGGGGTHLYFREPYPLRSHEMLPGLEIKATGTQVVAPPSRHPDTGRHYSWDPARTLKSIPIATFPTEIAALTRTESTGVESNDPLNYVAAAVYVPRLSGREPDRHGYVQCPFHGGGNERTPSLRLYEHGWKCFGCGNSGRIYQFAGLLAGWTLPLTTEARNALRPFLRTTFPTTVA